MPEQSSHEARLVPRPGTRGVARTNACRPGGRTLRVACVVGLAAALLGGPLSSSAVADTGVELGTAEDFGVLAGQGVFNVGPSVVAGDLGTSPGNSVIGFPPGIVLGNVHPGDGSAAGAQSDLITGYNDAASRPASTVLPGDIAGLTLAPGTYVSLSSLALSSSVTLDAQGDPNAVFIFQAGSTLVTGSGSVVNLVNGTSPCNVFWQVGSSANLGTASSFAGTILALTSINLSTAATLNGRAMARNGSVTMDTNLITAPDCDPPPPPTPIVVPSRATGLHVTSRSHRATLAWTRPASTGGAAIDAYQVANGSYRRNLTPSTRRALFTNLRNGGSFTRAPRDLYVRAHNSEGYGKWARATAFPNTPLLFDCAGAHRTPRHFDVACANETSRGYFDQARWTTWTGSTATGTARYRTFTVKLRADRVKTWQGPGTDTYFSRLRYGRTTLNHTIALAPGR